MSKLSEKNEGPDVTEMYYFALKSAVTRDKYKRRLENFFNFVEVTGKSFREKCNNFCQQSRLNGNEWTFNLILQFSKFHLERVNRREITGSTIQNYVKSIKLFYEIADISVPWKKITRGLPRGRNYADDRIPTIDEIQKILDYPDRRIKAIIFTNYFFNAIFFKIH